MRRELLHPRAPRPLELPPLGRAWVRIPTALDAVESEGKQVGWYLVRFLSNEDGSPMFREDEQAEAMRMPAWAATRVVEEVGRLMQPPPHPGEALAHAPRPQAGHHAGGDGEADSVGAVGMAAA